MFPLLAEERERVREGEREGAEGEEDVGGESLKGASSDHTILIQSRPSASL